MNTAPICYKKIFLISISLCALYAMPLFFFGGYYIDDLIRSLNGNTDWLANGRPLAELFMSVLFFGNKMIDISPIPQFISLLVVGITITLLSARYFKDRYLVGVLVFLPLWVSPFFLQNISYKYDAALMALSVFFAVISFCYEDKKTSRVFVYAVISSFLSLNLYQPSINLFLIFIVIDFIYNSSKGKYDESMQRALTYSMAFILSNIIYVIVIPRLFVQGEYSTVHSQIDLSGTMLSTIKYNFLSFYHIIKTSLPKSFFLALTPAILISITAMINIFIVENKKPLLKKTLITLLAAIALLASIVAVVGPMILLKTPTLAPRTLVGFSALLCLLLFCCSLLKTKKSLYLGAIIIPLVYMFEISYAYYNSLANQNRFEQVVISNISKDISEFNGSIHNQIALNGRVPLSPENKLSTSTFPIIKLLIPRTLNNSEFWASVQLEHYGIKMDYTKGNFTNDEKNILCNIKPLKPGVYYNTLSYNSMLIIDFTKGKCK